MAALCSYDAARNEWVDDTLSETLDSLRSVARRDWGPPLEEEAAPVRFVPICKCTNDNASCSPRRALLMDRRTESQH